MKISYKICEYFIDSYKFFAIKKVFHELYFALRRWWQVHLTYWKLIKNPWKLSCQHITSKTSSSQKWGGFWAYLHWIGWYINAFYTWDKVQIPSCQHWFFGHQNPVNVEHFLLNSEYFAIQYSIKLASPMSSNLDFGCQYYVSNWSFHPYHLAWNFEKSFNFKSLVWP